MHGQILAIDPDQFDSRHLLGFIFDQRGDFALAVHHIDRALQKNPDGILALNNRGIALNALMRFDEALASYDRAIALRPDFLDEALMEKIAATRLTQMPAGSTRRWQVLIAQ